MNIEVNTTKIIKLEAPSGLTDVKIFIYDSTNTAIVDNASMTESISEIYTYSWIPDTVGNYTGKIVSASLNQTFYFDINVTNPLPTASEIREEMDTNSVKLRQIKNQTLG